MYDTEKHYTIWLCWFPIVSVCTENMDIKQLCFSDEFKFDISNLLKCIHCEATFFKQFSENKNRHGAIRGMLCLVFSSE